MDRTNIIKNKIMKLNSQRTPIEEFPSFSIKKCLEGLAQKISAEFLKFFFSINLSPHDS